MDTPVLAVRHVSKSFAGVRALVDIDLEIAPGEIHCLVGENGSGKSTLIKVISGVHTPEHGTVSIDGRDFTRLTPAAAIDAGVRVIYQDFSIFPNLSVMENIALGSEVAAGRCLVNRSRMREVAREAVAKIGFDVDLDELVGNLSVADKQLVAISRALMGDAKLIIMDEPTTALTKKEVAALFDIVRDLQSRGIAILFVSHKLEEVFEIAQRFTILRSGHKVITCPKEELDRTSFARYMTGRDFAEERYQPGIIDEAPVLQVEGATVSGAFADASLTREARRNPGHHGTAGVGPHRAGPLPLRDAAPRLGAHPRQGTGRHTARRARRNRGRHRVRARRPPHRRPVPIPLNRRKHHHLRDGELHQGPRLHRQESHSRRRTEMGDAPRSRHPRPCQRR